MKIEGKLEIRGYLTITDLESGIAFSFDNDNELYMTTSSGDYFVSLENGLLYEISDYEDTPVHRVNATIVIDN